MGLKYHAKVYDASLSYLLIQSSIKNDKQLVVLSYSRWQELPDTDRGTGAYILFDQVVLIGYCTYVPVPVAKYSSIS